MQEYLRERALHPDVVGWQICSSDEAVSERSLDHVLLDDQALRFGSHVKSQDHGAHVAVQMPPWLAHLSDLVLDDEKDALGAMIGILYGVLDQDLIVWTVKPTLLFVAYFTPIWHYYGSKGEEIVQVRSEYQRANSIQSSEVKEITRNQEVVTQRSFELEVKEMRGNIGKTEVGARLSCHRSVPLYVS